MRHPFAGISVPSSPSENRGDNHSTPRPSRRAVVQGLIAGISAAALPWEGSLLADDEAVEAPAVEGPAANAHGRYLVMPKDYRQFSAARRKELGVHGDFFSTAMQGQQQVRGTGGFLAWLTAEEAEKLRQQSEVAKVYALTAEDIPSPASSARKGESKILIRVLPGDWKTKPAKGTYQSAEALLKAWQSQFKQVKGISFAKGPTPAYLVLEVGSSEPPAEVLEKLREQAQVIGLQWMAEPATRPAAEGGVTTQALGEEGGPTTQAIGEEGGPTTLAVGEEGGPTTLAVGEEGGPTTRALGEEGASTKALGEEGGPIPSTRRRGEEGGLPQPTTLALGEEGK